jgi:hypothetical protein
MVFRDDKQKFDYIISLGFSCHIAQDLEIFGYRNHAYPFDWVISDMQSINDLIENKFENFINLKDLYRDSEYNYIIKHRKYKIDFYHDFLESVDLSEQIQNVSNKYLRRINYFFDVLQSGKKILFIRYMLDEYFYPNEMSEINRFICIMQKYSNNFKIVLISNSNGGWSPYINDIILQHFFISSDNYRNRSPLFEPVIRDYFNNYIRYDYYHRIKNINFKYKKYTKNCLSWMERHIYK